MNCNNVAMLNAEVMSNNTIHTRATIIEIIISEDDENGVLALLSADENGIATEQLELLHRVVGQGDDRVVIIGSVRHP